jgi:hypothetical protein
MSLSSTFHIANIATATHVGQVAAASAGATAAIAVAGAAVESLPLLVAAAAFGVVAMSLKLWLEGQRKRDQIEHDRHSTMAV